MGSSMVLCGGIGAGNVTKLCNQIIVAVNIAAVSEALMLGQSAGVEPEKIFEAIKGGLAGSTVMNAKAPMMLDQNFKPGFRVDLHIKDLNNVLDAAKSVDSPVPLTAQVMEMMKILPSRRRRQLRSQRAGKVLSEAYGRDAASLKRIAERQNESSVCSGLGGH